MNEIIMQCEGLCKNYSGKQALKKSKLFNKTREDYRAFGA